MARTYVEVKHRPVYIVKREKIKYKDIKKENTK